MSEARPSIVIYTDGACSGNPGPGGWGAILMSGAHRKELSGAEPETTNNRMEVTAAIEALAALKRASDVELWTDSAYLRDGITKWIHGWKRNGWRTADKKPVKNVDLWKRLDEALGHHKIQWHWDKKPVKNAELWQALDAAQARHRISWHWLKGHAGHPENERADELAREAIAALRKAERSSSADG